MTTQYLVDAFAWFCAILAAVVLRYDFDVTRITWLPLLSLIFVTWSAQFLVGWVLFLYRGRHPYGSFAEVRALLGVVLIVGLSFGLPVVLWGTEWMIPRSTMFIAIPVAFVLMGSARYLKRLLVERSMAPPSDAEPALIYGAGYLGAVTIRRMVTDSASPYRPVAMIDDAPSRRFAWHHGIRVAGTGAELARVAADTGATVLVIAVARADAELLTRVSDAAAAAGLRVMVLPSLVEVLAGRTQLRDLRDISIEDLIGRHPVDTDVGSIAGYLTGARVLVTGAGGSIGSELCRQISRFSPAELIMVDHDETGLQSTQLSILGHGLLDTKDVVLASIRDADALQSVFDERRPQVVFHAAALKHLPMLEQYPMEAWKSNVLGTLNVLSAARSVGVTTFVNISTDKAANPTSVLGHSKRIAEKLTAWAAKETGKKYLSVRFGNVIGSRGSMLPTFTALIEAGGPLTVTHPDVTRYFMTIPEACQLVVQAGGIGEGAEVLILDMGEPVKIREVAERMIEMSGKDIEIVYTGLRAGEKLHEILVGTNESDDRRVHPKISHSRVSELDPADLDFDQWIVRCGVEKFENGKAGVPFAVAKEIA
ncbi:polysaccharide biosynthesis protein [Salinibacterium sp. UTAS2018]|nr:polysaccharide biosynthesis protein [Salinibacterium sp. UTAS2018]